MGVNQLMKRYMLRLVLWILSPQSVFWDMGLVRTIWKPYAHSRTKSISISLTGYEMLKMAAFDTTEVPQSAEYWRLIVQKLAEAV